MAKKVYIGNSNIARNVKSMYVGVNGVARKVKKAYIGVNGIARQFWPSIVYTWKKYTVNQIETYQELVEEINISNKEITSSSTGYSVYTFDRYTGLYTMSGNLETISTTDNTFDVYANVADLTFIRPGWYELHNFHGSPIWGDGDNEIYHIVKKSGIRGGITCFEMTRSFLGYENEKGSYVGQVISDDPDTYPIDGIHTDGYWYIRQ